MSSQNQNQNQFTTVCIRRGTKNRLEALMPYESMSWDEFADVLADTYEGQSEE